LEPSATKRAVNSFGGEEASQEEGAKKFKGVRREK
jgi:hypothetical protein